MKDTLIFVTILVSIVSVFVLIAFLIPIMEYYFTLWDRYWTV